MPLTSEKRSDPFAEANTTAEKARGRGELNDLGPAFGEKRKSTPWSPQLGSSDHGHHHRHHQGHHHAHHGRHKNGSRHSHGHHGHSSASRLAEQLQQSEDPVNLRIVRMHTADAIR
jgi:hypothetical protein